MKIFYSTYTLKRSSIPLKNIDSLKAPSGDLSEIQELDPPNGALLKIEWPDKKIGFSDIHPLTDFGDVEILQELAAYSNTQNSPLMDQSIWMARRDAIVRHRKINLFLEHKPLPNNYLLTADMLESNGARIDFSSLAQKGFTTLKIKLNFNTALQYQSLLHEAVQHGLALRIDFNSQLNIQEYIQVLEVWSPPIIKAIEYIEDPMPYIPSDWKIANEKFAVPLAIDHEYSKVDWSEVPEFSVIILKPARQKVDEIMKQAFIHQLKVAVTSSLDHCLGSLHAYHIALELSERFPDRMLSPGCLTHQLFKPDHFSSLISVDGPLILGTKGTGIGFDAAIEELVWTKLTE